MAKGHEGATPEKGPWAFTLDLPSYMAVLQHAKNRDLREALYRAYITRASSGDVDNGPLIERTLALKRERAELLGYPNHAEVSLASKMATLESALKLIEELRVASFEPAKQELEDVRKFAKSKGAAEADDLKHWDVTYWAERLREEKYGLKEEGESDDDAGSSAGRGEEMCILHGYFVFGFTRPHEFLSFLPFAELRPYFPLPQARPGAKQKPPLCLLLALFRHLTNSAHPPLPPAGPRRPLRPREAPLRREHHPRRRGVARLVRLLRRRCQSEMCSKTMSSTVAPR